MHGRSIASVVAGWTLNYLLKTSGDAFPDLHAARVPIENQRPYPVRHENGCPIPVLANGLGGYSPELCI